MSGYDLFNFPFVEIPQEALEFIGKPDPGTRMFRQEGPYEEVSAWHEVISSICGPMLSPGGVCMYAPVTRAAVHKWMKEGKITCFMFHVTERKVTLFGGSKTVRNRPYGYIPTSEAKAWGKIIEEKAVRTGFISREELEGAKPDWYGKFLEWDSKWRKQQLRKASK